MGDRIGVVMIYVYYDKFMRAFHNISTLKTLSGGGSVMVLFSSFFFGHSVCVCECMCAVPYWKSCRKGKLGLLGGGAQF